MICIDADDAKNARRKAICECERRGSSGHELLHQLAETSEARGDIFFTGQAREDVFESCVCYVAAQFFHGAVGDDFAVVENDDAVAEAFDDIEDVRGLEDRFSVVGQLADQIFEQ